MPFGHLSLGLGLVSPPVEEGGGDLPEAPEGFAYLVNADEKFIVNADGAYILAKQEA